MNEHNEIDLPELSEERVEHIERDVMQRIGDEPRRLRPGGRRRAWGTALGVAAAFVVGVMVAPGVLSALNPSTVGLSSPGIVSPVRADGLESAMRDTAAGGDSGGAPPAADGSTNDMSAPSVAAPEAGRDIITTAQVDLRVADVREASSAVAAIAAAHGGYVETSDISPRASSATDPSQPAGPGSPGSAWVSIRVAADDLDAVLADLREEGEVTRASTSRQDVTSAATDLRARVDAAQASVTRLRELMVRSGSLADLIAAESALNERQAQLESYQQELKRLDEQVALSTVTVQLSEHTTVAEAEPAGFLDGLLAGWNGLVLSANGLVVVLGFLLPWLVIAGLAALVVALIVRRRRRRERP